jgi:hypothetical protein
MMIQVVIQGMACKRKWYIDHFPKYHMKNISKPTKGEEGLRQIINDNGVGDIKFCHIKKNNSKTPSQSDHVLIGKRTTF